MKNILGLVTPKLIKAKVELVTPKLLCVGGLLLFAPFFVFAESESYSWSDLDSACFEKRAQIVVDDLRDFKVQVQASDSLFFVSGDNILYHRPIEQGEKQFLDYEIVDLKGVVDYSDKDLRNLKDNNPETGVIFDDLNNPFRSITVDMQSIYPAQSFSFTFDYVGDYRPIYYIGENLNKLTKVNDIRNFAFRYLKIEFAKNIINQDNESIGILLVSNINFTKTSDTSFVVKPVNRDLVYVYSDYNCEDKFTWQKIQNWVVRESGFKQYSVDIDTKKFLVKLSQNPDYKIDFDNDLIDNILDNCPFVANINQKDIDIDGVGDECDYNNQNKDFFEADNDKDKVADSIDNCRDIANPKQTDSNADGSGDFCSDDDSDRIIGYKDNCVSVYNPLQEDVNVNRVGDACEFDKDKDGIFDSLDNCMTISNIAQGDFDADEVGDVCDNCNKYNPEQIDKNNNGIGDVCEENDKFIANNDQDKDGILDAKDNCKKIANKDQVDYDADSVGDACDNCLALKNTDQVDKNKNRVGDFCEDVDGDGIQGYLDNCPEFTNMDQKDSDNDGQGDVCGDIDSDGVIMIKDNCPFAYNLDQLDTDGDKLGDKCDDKDNRFIESNSTMFIGFIVFVTLIFGVLIVSMVKKLKSVPDKVESKEDTEL